MSFKPLVFCAVISAASFSSLRADEDAFVHVAALFEAGWKPSIKGLEAAQELYQGLTQDRKLDRRVAYAFALVQMRNLKYDEARSLLDLVLAENPQQVAARRAKIWVLMVTREYDAGLVNLEVLVKSLADKNRPASENDDLEAVEFAGRVMGFIDGPAAGAVAKHVRGDYRKRLAGMLSAGDRQTFEDGYAAVQRQFAELDLDRSQTKADAKADEQIRKKRILDQLEDDRADLAQERSALDSRAEKLAADLKRELSELDAKLRPIVAQQARLEAQGAATTREMAGLQAEISRLLELADLTEDPAEALRLRAAARRLGVAFGRYDIDLRAINNDLSSLAAQRVQLAAQRQALVARQRTETDRLERRVTQIRNTEKRISTQERKASRPVAGNTAAVISLAAKARAFTTYETFPFEEERARLLQSLRDASAE